MAAKKETYLQAMERLEKIVRQIDNNELDIDVLSEKIKEANEIIAFCTEKLTKADKEVEKLLKEKDKLIIKYTALLKDKKFVDIITNGTAAINNVEGRHRAIRKIFQEVLMND